MSVHQASNNPPEITFAGRVEVVVLEISKRRADVTVCYLLPYHCSLNGRHHDPLGTGASRMDRHMAYQAGKKLVVD